jgi:hypothetical protein
MSAASNAFGTAKSSSGVAKPDSAAEAGLMAMDGMSSTPNPAIAMFYFFVVTAIYCIITIFLGSSDAMQKVVMKACYILAVIVGEYFINLRLSFQLCGTYQWQTILFITIIPWLLIFGVMHLFLTMFPGWLAPFSNTFGYLVVKLMGLPDLMKELKPENSPDPKAFQAIDSLMNDPSLLINQYSPESKQTKPDPSDPDGIKIIETRPIFNGVWESLKASGVIKNNFLNTKDHDKMRDKLYKYVEMKYTISELIWNLLAGGLVTSVSYNYIIGIGCAKSPELMKRNHEAYKVAQKQKLDNNELKQANSPNYRQSQ